MTQPWLLITQSNESKPKRMGESTHCEGGPSASSLHFHGCTDCFLSGTGPNTALLPLPASSVSGGCRFRAVSTALLLQWATQSSKKHEQNLWLCHVTQHTTLPCHLTPWRVLQPTSPPPPSSYSGDTQALSHSFTKPLNRPLQSLPHYTHPTAFFISC